MNRYQFGENWQKFITKNFSNERVDIARHHILRFMKMDNLNGLTFMDIGCGSGLHSLAALRAGAKSVIAIDYDENSVKAAKYLREHAGISDCWSIRRGDVLDTEFMKSLESVGVVYSWGVLHHTGDLWSAMRNAAIPLKAGGLFYIAVYSANVQVDPPPDFWLEVKRRYMNSGRFRRVLMVLWYIWRFDMGCKILRVDRILTRVLSHKASRGMSYFTDIRDWLGGWPMEFARDEDVVAFAKKELSMDLVNIAAGQANTEFLFRKTLRAGAGMSTLGP